MNAQEKAIEFIEKFDTKRDAILSIDILITMFIAQNGIEDNLLLHYWDNVKKELLKL